MEEEEEDGDRAEGRREKLIGNETIGTLSISSTRDYLLKREVNAHNMFHSPYRDWSPVGVKARDQSSDH